MTMLHYGTTKVRSVGFWAYILLATACSSEDSASDARITAISSSELEVGSSVQFRGDRFVAPADGWVDVTFLGNFTTEGSPQSQAVNLTVPLQANAEGTLSWQRFGAYRVPFGAGDQIGQFTGQVIATNRRFDEAERPAVTAAGLSTSVAVTPSVVLTEARAVGNGSAASCKDPSSTLLNGVPYLFTFKAVGFEPKQFDYTLGEGFMVGGSATQEPTQHSVPMLESEHSVLLQMASVPEAANGFRTSISIDALGTDGQSHRLEVPLVVRRPLQVYFPSTVQLAEIYPAEPVSGCIPGGKTGVEVTYSESHSETRTRSVTSTETSGWTENYGKQYAETYSSAKTVGTATTASKTNTVTDGRSQSWSDSMQYSAVRTDSESETAQLSFTKTDTDSYSWNLGAELSGSVSTEVGVSANSKTKGDILVASEEVDVGVQAKVGATVGGKLSAGESGTNTTSKSYSAGLAKTYGTSFSEGVARTYGTQWGLSQTYSEANSYSTQESVAKTNSYAEAVTNSQSTSTQGTTADSVTDSVSTTDTTLMNTKGNIPANQQAVWYRQTTRLVRRGVVVAYDLCGNGEAVGQIVMDDWTWAPNLAIGEQCPPATDLPKSVCFVEPCDG